MKSLARILFIALVVFGLTAQAQADPITVLLSDGINTLTCADGAACDASPLAGVVSFTSTLGTVTVSVGGTGSGTPALPPLSMDLAYNLTQVSGPGKTYTIAVSENNQSTTSAQWAALVNGNQGTGDTTAFHAYADASNVLFAQGTTLCSNGPVGTNSVAFTCGPSPSVPFSSGALSLTEKVTVTTIAGNTVASGDASLTPVPEPATMFLGGLGLIALGFAARRRLFSR